MKQILIGWSVAVRQSRYGYTVFGCSREPVSRACAARFGGGRAPRQR
ncbi:hypothetical protein WAE61_01460 [Comamonadaceae bacterium PP-2]